MVGFVYIWTNTSNGKWYIGSHKGTPDDGYRHTSKIMESAEQKYGFESFTRNILFIGDMEKDNIREIESTLLWFYDAANNPMSYNQTNITGPNCLNKKAREKIGNTHRGKFVSVETRKKQSLTRKGRKLSEEHRTKIANSVKGVNKGRIHTEEFRKRRAEIMRGSVSNNKGNVGKFAWYTDGNVDYFLEITKAPTYLLRGRSNKNIGRRCSV